MQRSNLSKLRCSLTVVLGVSLTFSSRSDLNFSPLVPHHAYLGVPPWKRSDSFRTRRYPNHQNVDENLDETV